MIIKRIGLKNFRNHQSLSFDFTNNLNVLTGLNAVGKTNIVEAIYYLSLHQQSRQTGRTPRARHRNRGNRPHHHRAKCHQPLLSQDQTGENGA